MADFDWVRARAECSLRRVFFHLVAGAESDALAREDISKKGNDNVHFDSSKNGDSLLVTRSEGSSVRRVKFALTEDAIIIEENGNIAFKATPGLNNTADCTLMVDGAELDLWKVRRMALERLFFESSFRESTTIGKRK